MRTASCKLVVASTLAAVALVVGCGKSGSEAETSQAPQLSTPAVGETTPAPGQANMPRAFSQVNAQPMNTAMPGTETTVSDSITPIRQLPPAATPEEAVAQLESALKGANFEAMKEIYAAPYGPLLVELNLASDLSRAQKELATNMQRAFGTQAANMQAAIQFDPTSQVKRVQRLRVVDKKPAGDRFELTVETALLRNDGDGEILRQESIFAVKQGDSWRLLPPFIEQQGVTWLEFNLREQKRMANCLKQVSLEVAGGKFQSPDLVQRAIQTAVSTEGPRELTAQNPSGAVQR